MRRPARPASRPARRGRGGRGRRRCARVPIPRSGCRGCCTRLPAPRTCTPRPARAPEPGATSGCARGRSSVGSPCRSRGRHGPGRRSRSPRTP
ncbi:hypothetical protein EJ357_14365 [Streptomyces cyaneochromogenes]|uniref:Uncharacterized protein n=1 Tax=Streptomyces cyaneochromogenes TaxID=2496836 RepID=A0A3Q9F166_9ACTN|nr:hypothetical protein EJ357_14365 [Streptomyces cyaneochromogenes]